MPLLPSFPCDGRRRWAGVFDRGIHMRSPIDEAAEYAVNVFAFLISAGFIALCGYGGWVACEMFYSFIQRVL